MDETRLHTITDKLQQIANITIIETLNKRPLPSSNAIHDAIKNNITAWAETQNLTCRQNIRIPGYKRTEDETTGQKSPVGIIDLLIDNIPVEIDSTYRERSQKKLLAYPSEKAVWLCAETNRLHEEQKTHNIPDKIILLTIPNYRRKRNDRINTLSPEETAEEETPDTAEEKLNPGDFEIRPAPHIIHKKPSSAPPLIIYRRKNRYIIIAKDAKAEVTRNGAQYTFSTGSQILCRNAILTKRTDTLRTNLISTGHLEKDEIHPHLLTLKTCIAITGFETVLEFIYGKMPAELPKWDSTKENEDWHLSEKRHKTPRENQTPAEDIKIQPPDYHIELPWYNGVYYRHDYYPQTIFEDITPEQREESNRILRYKNYCMQEERHNPPSEIEFTRLSEDILLAVLYLARKTPAWKICLTAVPPSKTYRKSALPKSIELITKQLTNPDIKKEYHTRKEYQNCSTVFTRKTDILTAHLGQKTPVDEQKASIECTIPPSDKKGTAYIILDDVVTTGTSMKVCKDILMEHGIPQTNIFCFALAHTINKKDITP